MKHSALLFQSKLLVPLIFFKKVFQFHLKRTRSLVSFAPYATHQLTTFARQVLTRIDLETLV